MAAHRVACPSVLAVPAASTETISAQINAATIKQHVRLNKLITKRLPLALPPNASKPDIFGIGLVAFARIYYAFESAWQDLVPSIDDTKLDCLHAAQVRQLVIDLRNPGLDRTQRLEADIEHISNLTGIELKSVRTAKQMLDSIHRTIGERPHLLIAYSWCMYMAIFSGGRWIRQQLLNAGSEFWTGEEDVEKWEIQRTSHLEIPGFSFLSFDGEQDGEDIRATFKARLAKADSLLTQQEREDVVQAAQKLFDDCITLVGMLDRTIARQRLKAGLPYFLICLTGVACLVVYGSSMLA